MNHQSNPSMDFEGRLLAELRAVVAERGAAEAASEQARLGAHSHPQQARRRRLALGGAVALASVVTACAVVLLSSGPATKPAAAEVLRQTATVAAASDSVAEAPPAPDQFLYVKTKVVELQGWLPNGPGLGPKANPRYFTTKVPPNYPEAPAALVATLKETWTGRDGATRERETLGQVDFFSGADQEEWEDVGSPPPFAYDPGEHDVGRDEAGRPLKDFESQSWRGAREFTYVRKLAQLPTEPAALRQALEHHGVAPGQPRALQVGPPPADSLRGRSTIESLMNVLSEPITSPALRAAAFNALAEIPGIELEHGVADAAGREGDAIWFSERGFGRQFIFDPHTSRVLSQAEMIFDAEAAGYPGVPDGTVFREIAFLRSGIVDSTDERPGQRSGA
ncbi:MAG TPA: CU044_5270 family protein [Solirubrobacterales bacterium]|nr:CU044_5270 family protein [Solirubrobacterales bacterium]